MSNLLPISIAQDGCGYLYVGDTQFYKNYKSFLTLILNGCVYNQNAMVR